jgi:tetratricopeptide (TPR) repeat protein
MTIVAEDRRGQRPARSTGGGRPSSGKPSSGKPSTGKSASGRPASGKPAGGRAAASGDRRTGGKPTGDRRGGGKPSGSRQGSGQGRASRAGDWKRSPDDQAPRTQEQALYDGPDLPAEVTGEELDRAIGAQLKGLPEKLANRVARHMVAAGLLVDTDPETAYQHTLAARARAPRLAVVREAAGEAAYAAGRYAEALAELRAAKRMNGATAYLPIMADCHRALGNPQQALKLAKSPSVANFVPEAKAEMTIVEAGARRDMGQLDAALRTLELAPLTSKSRAPWVTRLRYAYADILEASGRETDALTWFHRTHAVDSDEMTDAAERAEALEKRLGV